MKLAQRARRAGIAGIVGGSGFGVVAVTPGGPAAARRSPSRSPSASCPAADPDSPIMTRKRQSVAGSPPGGQWAERQMFRNQETICP